MSKASFGLRIIPAFAIGEMKIRANPSYPSDPSTAWTQEVESRLEQRSRAMQEQLPSSISLFAE